MTRGSYECKFFYHKKLPLCVALWADNNAVATLSNCYPPRMLRAGEGVDRRMRGENGVRDRHSTAVKIPLQTKVYVSEFDKIDKKNLNDSRYDLKGISKKHNWSPKINKRLYNIHNGNSGTYYERVCFLSTPDKRQLVAKERMADLAHHLCTVGESMRTYVPRHPAILRDLTRVFNSGVGRKIRSCARGICESVKRAGAVMSRAARVKTLRYKQQHREVWRIHQSVACERRGPCWCVTCPGQGKLRLKQKDTNMRCEQCSEMMQRDVFLCNKTAGKVPGEKNKWIVINCHEAFHKAMSCKK